MKEVGPDAVPSKSGDRAHVSSTSLGLICHSLADGISLGASAAASAGTFSATGYQSLDLIVFIAIMTHKIPVALGLCAVLLRDGASRAHVRRALIVFAAAAPLGALGTYALIGMLGSRSEGDGMDSRRLQWWTGELLCVSGGTFTFVATHVMVRHWLPIGLIRCRKRPRAITTGRSASDGRASWSCCSACCSPSPRRACSPTRIDRVVQFELAFSRARELNPFSHLGRASLPYDRLSTRYIVRCAIASCDDLGPRNVDRVDAVPRLLVDGA